MAVENIIEAYNIIRNGAPNLFDHAPFGSTCYSTQEDKIYIQMSKEEDQPNWVLKE